MSAALDEEHKYTALEHHFTPKAGNLTYKT